MSSWPQAWGTAWTRRRPSNAVVTAGGGPGFWLVGSLEGLPVCRVWRRGRGLQPYIVLAPGPLARRVRRGCSSSAAAAVAARCDC
eukprot:9472778-Pyramimonas_sp.AAC.1